MRGGVSIGFDQVDDAHLLCQPTQCLTLNDLRAGIGEEALTLSFEMAEHDIAHHGIEHGITQELQAFVVHGLTFLVTPCHALVKQGLFVIRDVAGIESDDFV